MHEAVLLRATLCATLALACTSDGQADGGGKATPGAQADAQAEPPASVEPPTPPTPPTEDPETIVGVDGVLSTGRAPRHLRFALTGRPDAALAVQVRSIALRTDAGLERLEVHELQVWPEGSDAPRTVATDETITIAAGSEAMLLMYVDGVLDDPRIDEFVFEAEFLLDGAPQTRRVSVRRVRREPI